MLKFQKICINSFISLFFLALPLSAGIPKIALAQGIGCTASIIEEILAAGIPLNTIANACKLPTPTCTNEQARTMIGAGMRYTDIANLCGLGNSANPSLVNVTVTFTGIEQLDGSNECSSETYMVLSVNNSEKVIWRNLTDRDISTFDDCDEYHRLNEAVTINNVPVGQKLEIEIRFYEKDGSYNLAAIYQRDLLPNEWLQSTSIINGHSRRADNAYGDQDYRVEYEVKVTR